MSAMDWIRRNWPDLLIGFALLAVISGIVATLLTGGSFLPGQGGNQPAPTPVAQQPQQAQTTAQQPQQAPTTGPQDTSLPAMPLLDQPNQQTDSLADGRVDPFAVATDEPATPAETDPQDLPVVVAIRPGTDPQATTTEPAAQRPQNEPQAQQPAAQQPAQSTQAAQTAPAQSTPPATSSSGQMPSAQVPYTVGVGAFQNADNAERQATVFRQAGYPVVVAVQDAFTVVLLGPYANRSEAERVSDAVASGGFSVSPIIYTYQGEDGAGQQTSAAAAAPAPAQTQTQTQTQTQAPAPAAAQTASSAGRYLQAGAYSSSENAGAQASLIEGLGFTVTQQQDGNLIRVLVGPFPEGQLDDARDRLAAQGIDSVPR